MGNVSGKKKKIHKKDKEKKEEKREGPDGEKKAGRKSIRIGWRDMGTGEYRGRHKGNLKDDRKKVKSD